MKRIGLLLSVSLLVVGAIAGAAFAGDLVIKGSTTVLPIGQAAAEKFMEAHPDTSISVSGGGSGNGIKAIIDQTTDIAMASRFIKDKEVKTAVEGGAYPVPFAVAIDALLPVVHPDNPVKDLTIQQLHDIYAGKTTNWKDLGGPDKKILPVTRDTSSGTFEVWKSKIMDGERIIPSAQVVASNGAMVQSVSGNPAAVGYIGIGYLDSSVKSVTVDGTEGNNETSISGEYPLTRHLFMFTPGWPTGDAMDFINYVLSDAGQEIVASTGYVPLR
ncbi:MAG: phosphate ABC transporter substrate-binding protein [Thermovirgaceae bacterium]